MKHILEKLISHKTLDREEAKGILTKLAEGAYNSSQMAAFLTIYMMRNITVDELQGFREAMLELCIKVPGKEYEAVDVCGTGGDGKDTFNISTLASFVVAGAGQIVAKHGNYGVSSICGSSNVLEYLGIKFTNDRSVICRSYEQAGIAFLHAPLFHPAMKNVAPIRKELGTKTFFNMLGPMVNPAFPKYQLVGVFSLELARLYGYLYQKSPIRYAILHGLDGYDEISLTAQAKIINHRGERILSPEDFGFRRLSYDELKGGESVKQSAELFLDVLENKGTLAQKQAVLANAALALEVCSDKPLSDCLAMATESLESGRAQLAFKTFQKIYAE